MRNFTQEEIDAEAWRIAGEEGAKRYNGGGAAAAKPGHWPKLDETAYHGLAGDVVSTIAPHSEADPVAILIQFLVAAGNIIGRRCYYQVEWNVTAIHCRHCSEDLGTATSFRR